MILQSGVVAVTRYSSSRDEVWNPNRTELLKPATSFPDISRYAFPARSIVAGVEAGWCARSYPFRSKLRGLSSVAWRKGLCSDAVAWTNSTLAGRYD